MTQTNYDVIIVGGGLAGLSLSCLLGQNEKLNIACIDRAPKEISNKDLRTTAISYGSAKILDKAGIWPLMNGRTSAINDIKILDGSSSVLLTFLSSEVKDKSFGWIVDNTEMRDIIMGIFDQKKNMTYIDGAIVNDFDVNKDHATCIFTQSNKEQNINAKLIIGADGRGSFTRQWMGIKTRKWNYNQRANICTIEHSQPHNNIAVEHFWPGGPFAILPMADDAQGKHRSSIVFTEHGPERNSLKHLSDTEFELLLKERCPEMYGDIKLIGKRAVYPLSLIHAIDYIGPRMALVADAAHGIHPIAGQGLNLGFRDIDEIGSLISAACDRGEDIGETRLLEKYQRRRRPDNMAMIAVTDGLNRLFSNNIVPIRLLRRAGLRAVSKLKPAKRFFMHQAMGDR